MKPNVCIINCQTGEETVRPMNAKEYAQYLVDQAAAENATPE